MVGHPYRGLALAAMVSILQIARYSARDRQQLPERCFRIFMTSGIRCTALVLRPPPARLCLRRRPWLVALHLDFALVLAGLRKIERSLQA